MEDFNKVMDFDRDPWLKEIVMHDDLFFKRSMKGAKFRAFFYLSAR